jgi:tetratricopeptide (TPR) repeat protein
MRANATTNSIGSTMIEEKVLKLLNNMQVVS